MITKTISIIKEIYKISPNGGALHIVLEDFNTDSSDIIWCTENTIPKVKDDRERKLYEKCADNLLSMSLKHRNKCIVKAHRQMKLESGILDGQTDFLYLVEESNE